MKVDVLLGLQWGDEGKGKIVDVLTPQYDIIARFQGGPNAGHTLEFDGRKHVLHTIPSGIFREGKLNLIGNGVVIDPVTLQREIGEVEEHGVDVDERLLISRKAHLILPTHRLLDAANEQEKGKDKIGSTLRGIGPTYMDKTGRNGLRVGDIFLPDFKARYDSWSRSTQAAEQLSAASATTCPSTSPPGLLPLIRLRQIQVVDSEQWINDQLDAGQRVLAEGAQGTLLDIDFRHLPLCDQLDHNGCRCLHGTRRGSHPYRRGHRHFQGILHAGRLRPVPHGTCTMKPVKPCALQAMNSAPQQGAPAAVAGSICPL